MNDMYSALDIANYIIIREAEQGRSVSNLRLQKLLYFVQAFFLVNTENPIFSDDIESWDFGPVIPKVYHRYKYYGSSGILTMAIDIDSIPELSLKEKYMIDEVLDYCAKYNTSFLVDKTIHQQPWKRAKWRWNKVITLDSIKEYFNN